MMNDEEGEFVAKLSAVGLAIEGRCAKKRIGRSTLDISTGGVDGHG